MKKIEIHDSSLILFNRTKENLKSRTIHPL